MASLVLNGNTSGSVTISSPAVSGTTTLTLPTTTSTLAINGPAFSAYQSTDQTGLTSNTYTKCNFQTEEYDTNSNFASSTFTPTVAGYYQINWGADLYAAGGGTGFISALYKNGSLYRASNGLFSGSLTELQVTGTTLIYMNGSSDYLDIYVRVVGGSARQTFNGSPYTFFNGFLARSA
jgi:hypothetical protein